MEGTLRALSDPTRREILKMLRGGPRTAGDIAARFDMTAPSVSHHLTVLKEAGLVDSERDGRNVHYSINTTVVQQFLEELLGFFDVGGKR